MLVSFQRNLVRRIPFERADHVGIDLRGCHVAVGEQLRDGVDVRAGRQLQRGEGVAEAVEGDVLRDACRLEPLLQVIGHDARGEVLEHLTVLPLSAQLYCLVANRQETLLMRFLRAEVEHPTAIG